MEYHECKADVETISFYVKSFQNLPCNAHTQAGIQKGNNLQILKGKFLSHTKPDVNLKPDIRNDMVEWGMIVGKKLIGVDIGQLMKFVNIFSSQNDDIVRIAF